MTANITSTGAVPDPTYGSGSPAATQTTPPQTPKSASNGPDPADLRLVIEDDRAAGCFVYKTVNWVTGEVVQQLPREQLVKLREASDYTAGAVISTKA